MWVRSWFKHAVMGELTPGTQLSMGSAKRLYVLMASFYMQRAFRGLAVKSRHRSQDLHLQLVLLGRLSSLPPFFCWVAWSCAWNFHDVQQRILSSTTTFWTNAGKIKLGLFGQTLKIKWTISCFREGMGNMRPTGQMLSSPSSPKIIIKNLETYLFPDFLGTPMDCL